MGMVDVSEKPIKVAYITTEFEYKGEWHKLTIDDALECWNFVSDVGKSVDRVGAKIHELLKQ